MTELKIAQLGEGLTEVLVVGLLAPAGSEIARDQPLLEVETDKAVMTIEAPGAGRLVEWRVKDGERVAVGEVFALIEPSSELAFPIPPLAIAPIADLPGANGHPGSGAGNGLAAPGNGSADRSHFAQSVRAHTDGSHPVNGTNGHGGNGYESAALAVEVNGHAPAGRNGRNGPGQKAPAEGAAGHGENGLPAPRQRGTRNGDLSPRERARLKSVEVTSAVTPAAAGLGTSLAPFEVPGPDVTGGVEVEIDPALEAASNLALESAPLTGAHPARQPAPYYPTDRQVRLRTAIDMSSRYTGEATISSEVSWDQVAETRRRFRAQLDRSLAPLAPEVIAWSAVRALRRHPRFRLINGGQKGYFEQDSVCFGMAVALPDDELGMATVENADTLTLGEFIAALRQAIRSVKAGVVSPGRAQFHLSYMATHGVDYAIPRVVYPAVATLFVGAAHDVPRRGPEGQLEWSRSAHFVLSFDHHVINGAGAARFLRDVATGLGEVEAGQA